MMMVAWSILNMRVDRENFQWTKIHFESKNQSNSTFGGWSKKARSMASVSKRLSDKSQASHYLLKVMLTFLPTFGLGSYDV